MRKVLGFLRKNWRGLFFVICFIGAIINFAIGNRDVIDWIFIILVCLDLILELTIVLIEPISNKILARKILKSYKQGFKAMKEAHQARYRLYFIGNSDEVEKYSQWIEDMGKILISYREDDELVQKTLSSKQMEYIKKLDSLVRQMLTTENPNMIKGLL